MRKRDTMSGSEDVPSVSSEPASAQTITLNGIGACTVRNVKCQMNATRGAASEFSRLPSWMQTEVNSVRYGESVNVTAPTSNEVTSPVPYLKNLTSGSLG